MNTKLLTSNNYFFKIFNYMLAQKGLMPQKAHLVSSFTEGRTEHSRDMAFTERCEIIKWLQQQPDSANKMRRKILSMAHEMGWHTWMNGKWQVDLGRLESWMIKYSYAHKKLAAYKYNELPKLVTQFEGLYKSHLIKRNY